MKKRILSFLLISASLISLSASAYETPNPDQASSDKAFALFAGFDIKAKRSDVVGFPKRFKIDQDKPTILVNLFKDYNGISRGESEKIFLSATEKDSIVFNFNDGDQVFMVKFKINDLKKLGARKVKAIKGIVASGYWWADGDHVSSGPIEITQ